MICIGCKVVIVEISTYKCPVVGAGGKQKCK